MVCFVCRLKTFVQVVNRTSQIQSFLPVLKQTSIWTPGGSWKIAAAFGFSVAAVAQQSQDQA